MPRDLRRCPELAVKKTFWQDSTSFATGICYATNMEPRQINWNSYCGTTPNSLSYRSGFTIADSYQPACQPQGIQSTIYSSCLMICSYYIWKHRAVREYTVTDDSQTFLQIPGVQASVVHEPNYSKYDSTFCHTSSKQVIRVNLCVYLNSLNMNSFQFM